MKLTRIALVAAAAALGIRLLTRETYSFSGRVVVITGGSRGLGLVIARELAREGAKLVILGRNPSSLERARADLESRGAEVLTIVCDIREGAQVRSAIERAASHFGRIDVLVNNAGIMLAGPLEHIRPEDFEDAMATHFWGPLHATFAAIPFMRTGARIVNISSIGGKIAVPHMLPYTASKFALTGLSDGLRNELAKDGIAVTTVCPGLMRTGSPINVAFRGDARKEHAWFSFSDRIPLFSMNARTAARKIIEACRRRDARVVLTLQAKAAVLADAVAPGLVSLAMRIANRLLPGPQGPTGDDTRWGFEFEAGDADSEANNEIGARAA